MLLSLVAAGWFIGGSFWLVGAWPVGVFMVLDIALICTIFGMMTSFGANWEEIQISREVLDVKSYRRSQCVDYFSVQTYWAIIELKEVRHHQGKLVIRTRGERHEVGRFLSWAAKEQLAHWLSAQIAKYSSEDYRETPATLSF